MRILIISLCLFLGVGCSLVGDRHELISETEEKHFQRAQRKLREGADEEALRAFMKVIAKRKEAPESHLEAGRLYLRYQQDPIEAIHHFRKYLEYQPESPHAQRVRALIDTARKEFARQLPGQPFQDDLSRIDLTELLKQVQAENVVLKKDLTTAKETIKHLEAALVAMPPTSFADSSSARKQTSRTSNRAPSLMLPTVEATPDTNLSGKTYKVQSGDTLSKISTKIYGTSVKWHVIYEANRDTLPNEHALKIGQVLKLP